MKLKKKIAKPTRLSYCTGNVTLFGLDNRTRTSMLAFGEPRNPTSFPRITINKNLMSIYGYPDIHPNRHRNKQ